MAKDDAVPERDRLDGAPHPRDQYTFLGHPSGERAFMEGLKSGRLHHAWLIGGQQGIGKATLAYRVARYLLARGPVPPAGDSLYISPDEPVSKQVSALSHPNLVVLRRAVSAEKKSVSATIPVDAVRKAMSLFETTSANGGYRICIVDSAEDLTISSANALLKLVEEPPRDSLFLIVSHIPQRVLPTIRSRCRSLNLSPLAENDIRQIISGFDTGTPPAEEAMRTALLHGEGSVRKTFEMLDPKQAAVIHRVESILQELPHVNTGRVLSLAESVAQRDAAGEFALVMECVERWVSQKIHEKAGLGASTLAQLVEVCEKLRKAEREVDVFNLARRPLVLSLFDDLAQVVRRVPG